MWAHFPNNIKKKATKGCTYKKKAVLLQSNLNYNNIEPY